MKKYLFLFTVFFSFALSLFAEVPEKLSGIWEGKDRYVFFEEVELGEGTLSEGGLEESGLEAGGRTRTQVVVILKTYYGWYLDRFAEDKVYGEKTPRDRNAATPKKPVYINPSFSTFYEDENSGEYELLLQFARHNQTYVPLCLIDNNLYLEFFTQSDKNPVFWRGHPVTKGITVSEQAEISKFNSWYVDENTGEVYKIPFWKSNMEYDEETPAKILSGSDTDDYLSADIDKHIFSCNTVYTCVPGRRVNVRNLKKTDTAFDGKKMVTNESGNLTAVESPYLVRLADKKTFEDLMEIVRVQNSRRKPDPPPLFPDSMELDYHWDIIDLLESDNQIIQAVRRRQKDFGVRGKDYGR